MNIASKDDPAGRRQAGKHARTHPPTSHWTDQETSTPRRTNSTKDKGKKVVFRLGAAAAPVHADTQTHSPHNAVTRDI